MPYQHRLFEALLRTHWKIAAGAEDNRFRISRFRQIGASTRDVYKRQVLGLALDGVGLGTDGTAWGGEVLRVNGAQFQRIGHLLPLALPGGDVAAREPWRMAAAALHACDLAEQIVPRFGPVVGELAARTVHTMLQRSLNCPQTSAAGRWFDAAAGLLGLSVRQQMEAQAAIALEQAAAQYLQDHTLEVRTSDWVVTPEGQIDLRPLVLSTPVSYTHLDVYKRQVIHGPMGGAICTAPRPAPKRRGAAPGAAGWPAGACVTWPNRPCTCPVSYTHLDVYKRQKRRRAALHGSQKNEPAPNRVSGGAEPGATDRALPRAGTADWLPTRRAGGLRLSLIHI